MSAVNPFATPWPVLHAADGSADLHEWLPLLLLVVGAGVALVDRLVSLLLRRRLGLSEPDEPV